MKKITSYFSKYPTFNSVTHLLGGIGIGILITMPFLSGHTLRWGLILLALAVIGHIYAWHAKK